MSIHPGYRPEIGPCPSCGAEGFCETTCDLVDLLDWR